VKVWRPLREEDRDEILALHQRQTEGLGQMMTLPDLYRFPVVGVKVCEEDGKIKGVQYLELVAEAALISDDPQFVREVAKQMPYIGCDLSIAGIETVRCFVLTKLAEHKDGRLRGIGATLKRMGFTRLEDEFRTFTFDLPR
jgi:hypothetical protein